jgi:flagellar basal-body rod modification protein FlgD
MEVTSVPTVNATPSVNTTPRPEISSDFETFLKMLTVQLENQDPLNPVEAADYAVQLATFSGVEQQVQTNDLLKQLSSQLGTSGLSQMASWVGMEARVAAPAFLGDRALTVLPDPDVSATSAELVVRDASGREVQRLSIPVSKEAVTFTGATSEGAFLPNGVYSFETVSYDGTDILAQSPAQVYGRVTEVQSNGGTATLILEGGAAVKADEVSALREAVS